MATDERNFRSAYYEKVGFRSVEEKKSLEILLKEKPLDRGKLKQFCLRFSLPATYRSLVWKLLLGVVPVHIDCHTFIMDQRKQEYQDLYRALNVMRIIDANTPKPQIFFAMWMLQAGNFSLDKNLVSEKGFIPIAQSFMQFVDDDSDVYWLSKNFYDNVCKFESEIPKLIERSYSLLEKEDSTYYKHLLKEGILDNLPLAKWFDCCFAGILNDNALAKIWDKLCGGSYKILVYVVVTLLINMKLRILKCNNFAGVLQYIKNIPEETADIIVNKSIEMWQQHGSLLTIYDKPKP
ncbi:TBC1 domain family member 7 [Leptinotarsa decemlineata]|uniref:TBC1 domain family member 7 n=1 Tax=Leptinotarsa decemlineata TaxID=7539 RepID=UPI003D304A27